MPLKDITSMILIKLDLQPPTHASPTTLVHDGLQYTRKQTRHRTEGQNFFHIS
jgi:hypothetical protein